MKKLSFIVFIFMLLSSCYNNDNNYEIGFEKGSTKRIIETKDYIITERYDGRNGLGHSWWKLESIRKKSDVEKINKKDSI